MSKLDAALEEIWDATELSDAPAVFNAAVLERVARRRAYKDLSFAAVIAVAVWAVALALGSVLAVPSGFLSTAIDAAPTVTAFGVIAGGLGLFAAMRMRRMIEPGFWSLGFAR